MGLENRATTLKGIDPMWRGFFTGKLTFLCLFISRAFIPHNLIIANVYFFHQYQEVKCFCCFDKVWLIYFRYILINEQLNIKVDRSLLGEWTQNVVESRGKKVYREVDCRKGPSTLLKRSCWDSIKNRQWGGRGVGGWGHIKEKKTLCVSFSRDIVCCVFREDSLPILFSK